MPHPSSSVSNLRLMPRNTSNSTPAHNVVVAALSHKHHPVINVGAGPIQLGHGPPSHPAADAIHQKNLFSPFSPVSYHVFWSFLSTPFICYPQRISHLFNKARAHCVHVDRDLCTQFFLLCYYSYFWRLLSSSSLFFVSRASTAVLTSSWASSSGFSLPHTP